MAKLRSTPNIVKQLRKKHANVMSKELLNKHDKYIETNKAVQDLARQLASEALENMSAGLIMSLRDECGFGAKRIERVIDKMLLHTECIIFGKVTRDDIYTAIKEETKFDFEKFMDKKWNSYNEKVNGRLV